MPAQRRLVDQVKLIIGVGLFGQSEIGPGQRPEFGGFCRIDLAPGPLLEFGGLGSIQSKSLPWTVN